jgi:WD40 repeat protein
VVMRDLEKKATLRTFQIKSGRATALAVASDDETFAVGDHRGVVHIFHVNAAKEIFELKCHDKEVTDLAFGPDNTLLVSSGRDGTIQLLNSRMGVTLAELKGHSGAVNSIAVTPDGRYVISAGNDLTIRMWDANVHQQKKSIQESADKLLNMVLSLDGSMVASSTVDIAVDLRRHTRKDIRHIKIRNTITGEEIRTLSGHKKDVTTLAFHPDKRFLASGSVDRSIRIWDLQMGEAVTVMQQEDAVQGVDFSNNGKWFAALSRNQRITVWKLR